jgi:hypothetical protein
MFILTSSAWESPHEGTTCVSFYIQQVGIAYEGTNVC